MLGIKYRVYIWFAIINVGVYLIQAAVASDVNSQGKVRNLQPRGELKDTSTEKLQKSRNNVWKMVVKAVESKDNTEIFNNSRKKFLILATSRKAQNQMSEEIKTNLTENSKRMLQENNPKISKNIQKKSFVLSTSRKAQKQISKETKKTSRINLREKVKTIHQNEDPESIIKNSKSLTKINMVLATSRKASNQMSAEFKQILKENSTETQNLKKVKGFLQSNSSFNVNGHEETPNKLKLGSARLLKETQELCSKGKTPKRSLRKFKNVRENLERTAADLKSPKSPTKSKLFRKNPREGKHKQLSTALRSQQTGLGYERHPAYSVEERQTQDQLYVAENRKRSKRQEDSSIENSALLPSKVLNLKVHEGMNPASSHFYPIFQVLAESLTLSNLKMMERYAQIRTVVLIGSPDFLRLAAKIFNYNYPPIVIVSKLSERKLKDYHNKQILALVFLKETFKDSLEILDILRSTLFRLHMRKMLFILPQLGTYERDVVKWCFDNGFWNSLFMDYEGRSLAYNFLAHEYKNNLSVEEFLSLSIYWTDLKGFKVRCLMASNPPRAYIFNNTDGKIDYRGYYGTILSIFAKHYNVTLMPVILSDLGTYRELDCIEHLQQNVIDLCGDVLTAGFADGYAETNCDEMTTSMLMVPHDKPLPKYMYFFKPFQLHVWTIVTVSFLYKILTLAFIHRIQHGFWNASLQITYATLSVIHLPFSLTQVKGKYRRFLELLLISVGFVVSNWYLAVLSSVLFTSLYHQGINSLEDLKRYNISIMVNEFEYYQLHTMANHPIIMEQLMLVSNDVLHQHRSNLDMNYAYYNQYDKIYLYLYQQKYLLRPRMKILQNAEPMNPVLGVLPIQTNWPFEHLLNLVLRSAVDYGFYLKILEDGMLDGIRQGHIQYVPTEYTTVDPLSVEHFNMPALILLVGYVLALMGFIVEIIGFKIKKIESYKL